MIPDDPRVAITHGGSVRKGDSRPPASDYFEVVGTVGSGGMGDVHAARDLDLGRVVALKVIGSDVAGNSTLTARFLTEAQVTAQLDHPHIVPVYRLEKTEQGTPAFSMKLIRGQTLSEVLEACRSGEGPELTELLESFVSVCNAMAYAHERGVIHRDLKPDNVMIGAHGEVYVVDWGVAKVFGRADEGVAELVQAGSDSAHETQAGLILGTPLYLSPELAMDDELDGRSDIYTLGLILQEIVTLERASPAKTSMHALALAEEGERKPMIGPRDLCAIVARACHLDKTRRYQTAEDLARDVRRYIRGEEVSARPDGVFRRFWRWTRGNPVPTLIALGALLGSAAGITILSLVAVVAGQVQSAAAQQRMGEQVSAVSRRSQAIDTEMMRYQSLLDGVAQQTMRLWSEGVPSDEPTYDRAAFEAGSGPPDYRDSSHYGMPVSFTDPLTLWAPDVDREAEAERVARLTPLRRDFRRVFLRAANEQAVAFPADAQDTLLRDRGVPPAWVYVGLENGVLLNYPGHPRLGEGYDPRKRPWYRSAIQTRGPRWGEPYQGASGYSILVPCNEALYDAQGRFFGVAGLDVALDTVIEMMAIDLEGATNTWLVDAEGNVVVSSDQRGMNLGEGLHDNQAIGTEPFPHEGVREAIAAGAEYGHHEVDGGVVIFDRMDALGFTYAVEIED